MTARKRSARVQSERWFRGGRRTWKRILEISLEKKGLDENREKKYLEEEILIGGLLSGGRLTRRPGA
jgi:hypothetical protein